MEIITYPNEILTTICEKILPTEINKESTKKLVKEMIETMEKNDGIGLAANQVGIPSRIIVYKNNKNETITLFNPFIIARDGRVQIRGEGCLSFPGETFTTKRSKRVVVGALNEWAEFIKIRAKHMESVVLQHEIDHLDGKTLLSREVTTP